MELSQKPSEFSYESKEDKIAKANKKLQDKKDLEAKAWLKDQHDKITK